MHSVGVPSTSSSRPPTPAPTPPPSPCPLSTTQRVNTFLQQKNPQNLSDARWSTKRILLSAPREAGDQLQVIPALICSPRAATPPSPLPRCGSPGKELSAPAGGGGELQLNFPPRVTEEVFVSSAVHTYSVPPKRARIDYT